MNSYLFNYSLVHHKKYTMAKCNGIMYLFMCLLTYGVLFILFYFMFCCSYWGPLTLVWDFWTFLVQTRDFFIRFILDLLSCAARGTCTIFTCLSGGFLRHHKWCNW